MRWNPPVETCVDKALGKKKIKIEVSLVEEDSWAIVECTTLE